MTGSPAIDLAGWAFLFFAGMALPLAAALFAVAERRRATRTPWEDAATSGASDSPRGQIYAQALLTHAVLLGAAIAAVRAEHLTLFPHVTLGTRHVVAAAITLAAVVAIGELSWRLRTSAERERLWVRRILPHTSGERRAWIVVSAAAAMAEEVAYRGAFVAFAVGATGSVAVAVVASAVAFAVVHAPQGLAGTGYVFVIALLHQALVLYTGTLLLAIVVHFAYDVLAGLWLARRHGLTTAACCVLRPAS